MITYLDDKSQTEYIRKRGVSIGDFGIRDAIRRKRGPKYVVILGKRLSTKEWLDAWLEDLSQRPFRQRSQGQGTQAVQS